MERNNSRHHILFPAQEWMLRPEGRNIRTTPSMIISLNRADHDIVHDALPIIPALGHNTLRAVSRLWVPERNTYRDLDNLCRAIGQAALHERSHPIESGLAELTIEALELEKQALKDVGFKSGSSPLRLSA